MTNSFGNRNFMQPMEGPRVHSRCLAFIPFKWEEGLGGGGWGEGFFSFFFGSQCVPQYNITMCSFSLPPIKTPRTPPPSPPPSMKKIKIMTRCSTGNEQWLEEFSRHCLIFVHTDKQIDASKKARWTRKSHLVYTDSKYTVPDRLTNLLN